MTLVRLVDPPRRVPWHLRPGLALTRWITGKDPLPARLLARFPKGAVGAGIFELLVAGARDLRGPDGARVLAAARLASSVSAGCPFCVDMNAATWRRAGLTDDELRALVAGGDPTPLGPREAAAVRYARALSRTPVVLDGALIAELRARFEQDEIVVLAHTVAAVNFWARFNQGLDVPSAGFFDESVCNLSAGRPTVR